MEITEENQRRANCQRISAWLLRSLIVHIPNLHCVCSPFARHPTRHSSVRKVTTALTDGYFETGAFPEKFAIVEVKPGIPNHSAMVWTGKSPVHQLPAPRLFSVSPQSINHGALCLNIHADHRHILLMETAENYNSLFTIGYTNKGRNFISSWYGGTSA